MKNRYVPIHEWAKDDRPREKLLQKGKNSLSNAELLAILISTGTKELSAVDLGKHILRLANDNLNELGKLNIKELMKVKGIGEAKAISIAAALELGARRKGEAALNKPAVTSSRHVFDLFHPIMSDLKREEFWVLFLSRAHKILHRIRVSEGGTTGTVVDSKVIFKIALDHLASSIIFCHNHPSGNHVPSQNDIDLTHKLAEAGKLLDIKVVDHVIVADNKYFSFADEGML